MRNGESGCGTVCLMDSSNFEVTGVSDKRSHLAGRMHLAAGVKQALRQTTACSKDNSLTSRD